MRLERFLPADFLFGDEWMAPRQLSFAARTAVVTRPTRLRFARLNLISSLESDIELTGRGAEALRLGMR